MELQERVEVGNSMHQRFYMDPATGGKALIFICGTLQSIGKCTRGEYFHLASPPSGSLKQRFKDACQELQQRMRAHTPAAWKRVFDVGECTPQNLRGRDRAIRLRRTMHTEFGRFEFDMKRGFTFASEAADKLSVGMNVRCVAHLLREDHIDLEYDDGTESWTSTWYLDILQACRCVTTAQEERSERQMLMTATFPDDGRMSKDVANLFVKHEGLVLEMWQDSVEDRAMEIDDPQGEDEGDDEVLDYGSDGKTEEDRANGGSRQISEEV
uniref:Fungal-type protein kinase domain-containing protein n=1 Tax=Mycena chlorophos TaxID=658473 RepID=A0ABQ0LJ91_MYCCL|nr:predicted protein [Mycena chlorophos]